MYVLVCTGACVHASACVFGCACIYAHVWVQVYMHVSLLSVPEKNQACGRGHSSGVIYCHFDSLSLTGQALTRYNLWPTVSPRLPLVTSSLFWGQIEFLVLWREALPQFAYSTCPTLLCFCFRNSYFSWYGCILINWDFFSVVITKRNKFPMASATFKGEYLLLY